MRIVSVERPLFHERTVHNSSSVFEVKDYDTDGRVITLKIDLDDRLYLFDLRRDEALLLYAQIEQFLKRRAEVI